MQAVTDQFDAWGVRHAGLCTFPQSPFDIVLYGKLDTARFLTPVMIAPARAAGDAGGWTATANCRKAIGLLSRPPAESSPTCCTTASISVPRFRIVTARGLGDTLLRWDGASKLGGFAVCHWGPASEAGENCCFVKFGAVRPGAGDAARFAALLDGCGALAAAAGMETLLAGVNVAREEAYQQMIARGFRGAFHVITMHRPNEAAYSRPGLYVLDDWR